MMQKAAIVMTKINCIIVGVKIFSRNEYDGDTLKSILPQWEEVQGKAPERALCDRGFRGRKRVGNTAIVLPESPSPKACGHAKRKAHKDFGRRSAIETAIGHMKSDFHMARNYLKETIGDAINLLMAAAAFNCVKWMKAVAERLFFALITLCALGRRDNELDLQRYKIVF